MMTHVAGNFTLELSPCRGSEAVCPDDPKSFAGGVFPLVGSTLPDWSRVRDLKTESLWFLRLEVWHGAY